MTCHDCVLCGGNLVKVEERASINFTNHSNSNPTYDIDTSLSLLTDLDPVLETSTQSAGVCLESILNFWEIPSEATRQLLQSEAEGSTDHLTASLFCTSCIQRNTEILELTRQISIFTERVATLKTSLESKFRATYTNEGNHNPENYADSLEYPHPVCKLELFLTEEDRRIQNLAKNLRLLFAQSLIGPEELHVETEILFPPNSVHSQLGILDPGELTQEFDSVEFSEDSSASTPESDNSTTDDPTFSPKEKLKGLKRRKCEARACKNEVDLQSQSENLVANTKSMKYRETKSHQTTKLECHLSNRFQLKDASVIVEKLSPDQVAQFSKNCTPLKASTKTVPKKKLTKKKKKKSQKEVNSDDELDRLPCPIPTCRRSFLTEEDRDLHHKKKHEGITHPYTCEECGRKFHQLKLYTVHVNAHRGEYPFVCDVCGYGFIKKAALIEHQRSHSSVTEFQCKLCPKAYKGHQGLKSHMLRVHKKEKPYTCHICGKSFIQSCHLRRHLDSVHSKEKSRICPLCGKMFAIQNYLYMHMRMHEGKPFPSTKKNRNRKNENTASSSPQTGESEQTASAASAVRFEAATFIS